MHLQQADSKSSIHANIDQAANVRPRPPKLARLGALFVLDGDACYIPHSCVTFLWSTQVRGADKRNKD